MNRFQPYQQRSDWVKLMALATLLLAWVGCKQTEAPQKPSAGESGQPSVSSEASSGKSGADAAGEQKSPRQILESMVAKYKGATSYVDKGTVHLETSVGGQKMGHTYDFSVALARPNKIRMEVHVGNVVCDGKDLWASSGLLPDQILRRKAPEQLSFKDIFGDESLATALTQGPTLSFSWVPPQLLLLWAEDPMRTILYQAQEPVLAGTSDLGGQLCYRIEITRLEGKHVLWIDTQSLVLRRLEYPFEDFARQSDPNQPLENGTLIAEFQEAQLDPQQISPDAFRFEPDPSMEVVEDFTESGVRMLGKPGPDFKFVDLDGKEITPKSLEGKIAVLYFWATWCGGPCRTSLPLLEKVYQEYKSNDKVQFLAVSVDEANTSNDQLRQAFADLKGSLPIVRDPDQHVGKLFHTMTMPTMFVVGSNGVVQCADSSPELKLAPELSGYLKALLDGRDVHPQLLGRAEEEYKKKRAVLEKWIEQGLFIPPMSEGQEIPKADVAPKNEPKAFSLKSLWKTGELKDPGNILVVPRADGSSQILVLEGVKSVAEIGPDGKIAAIHPLELEEEELASFLRTAVDGKQKRYFVTSGSTQMRTHVFDEKWKPISTYPADALQNRHAGIFDVQLADLEGNGSLQLCVGYWGVVGVQGASLEGKRLWSNRSLDTVMRIAVLDPDAQGKRSLLCANSNPRGALVTIDSQGNPQGELIVPESSFQWIVAADLDGSPPQELCGISVLQVGVCEAIGLNLKGQRLWAHPLPKGVPNRPIEQIVSGRLKTSGPGQWLLPAPDGSIHVIAADGQPIDQFNYGAELHGLATAQLNGRPVLLITSAGNLEALEVNWPNP